MTSHAEEVSSFGYDWKEGAPSKPITVWDKLRVWVVSALLPLARWRCQLYNYFSAIPKDPKTINIEANTGHLLNNLTSNQVRIFTPSLPLRSTFERLRGKLSKGLPNYNHILDGPGFSARWISEVPDRQYDDPVIVYIHGGAYAWKLTDAEAEYPAAVARDVLPYRGSVLVLDYTVTQAAKFPTQLEEALAMYQVLKPTTSKLILIGVSAGGNLVTSMLLREDIIQPGSVYGVVLSSPWVDMSATTGSIRRWGDILSYKTVKLTTDEYLEHPDLRTDPLVSPLLAGRAWLERVRPSRVAHTYGSVELMYDQNNMLAQIWKPDKLFVQYNATHDAIARGLDDEGSLWTREAIKEMIQN